MTLRTDQWIERFKAKRGDKFDYSRIGEICHSKSKVTIICPSHGPFEQTPEQHFRSAHGCAQCYRETLPTKQEQAAKRKAYEAARKGRKRKYKPCREWTKAQKAKACVRTKRRYHANKHTVESKTAMACRSLIRRTVTQKTARTEEMLGYTAQELRERIERTWAEWMNWDNYGEWHIDHIKPIAAFTAEGETRPHIINALSNLQALSARDNIAKGASVGSQR